MPKNNMLIILFHFLFHIMPFSFKLSLHYIYDEKKHYLVKILYFD